MPDRYQSGDRRPIASRNWKGSQILARWLAEHHISANAISVAGMVFGLVAGAGFALTHYETSGERALWTVGAVFIQLRLLANMLDGMVAIQSGRASPVGELFNEVPDRISDSAVLIGLGYAANASPNLGYVAALFAILTAYVRAVGKVAGAPQEFCGPMAKQQRMFLATITGLFYAAAPRQWRDVSGVAVADIVLLVIAAGSFVTAVRRLTRVTAALRKGKA